MRLIEKEGDILLFLGAWRASSFLAFPIRPDPSPLITPHTAIDRRDKFFLFPGSEFQDEMIYLIEEWGQNGNMWSGIAGPITCSIERQDGVE